MVTSQTNTTEVKNCGHNYFVKNRETAENLGKKLKSMRLERKMYQVDFAVAADINPNHYSKIERGKVGIRLSTFKKLATGLNMSPTELFMITSATDKT